MHNANTSSIAPCLGAQPAPTHTHTHSHIHSHSTHIFSHSPHHHHPRSNTTDHGRQRGWWRKAGHARAFGLDHDHEQHFLFVFYRCRGPQPYPHLSPSRPSRDAPLATPGRPLPCCRRRDPASPPHVRNQPPSLLLVLVLSQGKRCLDPRDPKSEGVLQPDLGRGPTGSAR